MLGGCLAEHADRSRPLAAFASRDDRRNLAFPSRSPQYPLLNMIAQTQGIVGVITGVVAAPIGAWRSARLSVREASTLSDREARALQLG